MPLHLLGKKSWNVYNRANIEKVKQDEDAAAAKEAAEERRMQEVDAERRVRALRGLQIDPLPGSDESTLNEKSRADEVSGSSRYKRRRLEGEDDTERDIRYAKESYLSNPVDEGNRIQRRKTSNAPLVDHGGHINLFPVDGFSRNDPKNPEAEAELATKKREYEDQYTMRFSNAAGFKQVVGQEPWYHSIGDSMTEGSKLLSKETWGNGDLRRKERQQVRIAAEDPLAVIQKGVKDLQEVEKQRRKWKEERNHELQEIAEAERRRARRRRARSDGEELEGFILDHGEISSSPRRHRHKDRHEEHGHRKKRHRHSPKDRDDNDNAKHLQEKNNEAIGWRAGSGGRYSSQFAGVKS